MSKILMITFFKLISAKVGNYLILIHVNINFMIFFTLLCQLCLLNHQLYALEGNLFRD
ncbi:exported hypothetical protein [Capnocytophaga cynodegmi]|uniref:Uncharacterized protein n=1 Tax=Capnocytophaga cynodegmi TaxID=28189 RepID=A0A0B7H8E4_9FLAO|nr:exported hypothetical protein [Capnocytophaga cynodegmi]CEN36595.1 exported hypothetical protein [Capnocytophaga cynodegmi]